MRPLFALSALAAIVAARPAQAQKAVAPTDGAPRVVATYTFADWQRDLTLPRQVIVADSAGTIVASAELPGTKRQIPLTVTILNADLMLQGSTADGVLTLVIERQNDGNGTRVASGRWMLGSAEGTLRGTVVK